MSAEQAAPAPTIPVHVDALRCTPPLHLRDDAGRRELLADLTSTVASWDHPMQLWHGPAPLTAPSQGRGEASRLLGELVGRARPRHSLLQATPSPRQEALPQVVAEGRRHVQLDDGQLGRVLALREWPATVTPDWLGCIAAICTWVAVHLRPVDSAAASRLLRRRLASLTSSATVDEQSGRLPDPTVRAATDAAIDLRRALAAGTTRLLHTQVLLALSGQDIDELDRREQQVRDVLVAQMAGAAGLPFEQAPAWQACQPGSSGLRWPWRLLDATSAACTLVLPFGPAMAEQGVLAGREPDSGVPLLVDRFAAHNPTRLVVGTSGAGKSYATKLEVMRQLVSGADAVVVDPEGEFSRLAEVLGGVCLAVGEEPAGLDPVGLACRPRLAPSEGLSVLTSWASALLGTPLTSVDLAILDRALGVLRADPGAAPTTGDLLSLVTDLAGHAPFTGADLPARLAPAAHGTVGDLFAPNPDLADPPPLVVFDLRAVPDRVRPAVMSCVLTWAWCQSMDAAVARRRIVVVDEAHLLLDDPPAAQLLAQFARRARKYGVALEVVTQRLSDFLGHPAGEAVLSNAASKLLLGCEDRERQAIATGLGLTAAESRLLQPGTRGRGLLLTPQLRTAIDVVAGPAEHQLASAGPR